MGFLAPVFLIAASAIAIPLLLHLFHRHDSRRLSFPAIRYLLRTEKEHARKIRLRQLILLFLRIAVILLVVLAGARLFVRGSGSGHDPTAVAIVLDNSMSSGLVVGETRVLDELKQLALETTARATTDDQIWVIRVGEPWDVAPPGGPVEAEARIRSTELSTASGNVSAALARARELLLASGKPAREIHLLSDLQLTAFRQGDPNPAGDVPVVVYHPEAEPRSNRYLHEVLAGGGLAPLAGQRTEIAVSLGATDLSDTTEIPLRLLIDGQIRGASSTRPGRVVALPIGPLREGMLYGYIETDPDALSADDRRPFAFPVRPPPSVAVVGGDAFFLEQALAVLEQSGRVVRGVAPAGADLLFSVAGEGVDARRPGQVAVLIPPTDATLLPAMNLRLSQAGLPWRVEREPAPGEAQPQENRLPLELTAVRVLRRYDLQAAGGEDAGDQVAVRLSTGKPWIVSGTSAQGPYVLLGSPLDPETTTLPVSAAMVPLLEWMTGLGSAAAVAAGRVEAGQPIRVPPTATQVRTPGGTTHAVDGAAEFRETREAGIYEVLRADSVLEHVAVGPPVRESLLTPLDEEAFEDRIGARVEAADDARAWNRQIFVTRQGPELWKPLLVLAMVLLLVEAWVAAAGSSTGARSRGERPAEERGELRVPAT
jgi:hypothetical protein